MTMNRKGVVLFFIVVACLVAVSPAHAGTADGFVHSKGQVVFFDSFGGFIVIETLKIQRWDGTKVNADCRYTAMTCNALQLNDNAIGTFTCSSGWCTWDTLDFN